MLFPPATESSAADAQAGPGEAQAPGAAAELRCQAGTLLGAVMDLAPLHAAAAAGRLPEAAARAMQARAGGLLMQHAGLLSERLALPSNESAGHLENSALQGFCAP